MSVLRPWVLEMSLKDQSKLLSGLRGPDGHFCPHLKRVVKRLRRYAQFDADPTSDYMATKDYDLKEVERELEFCTLHFVAHFLEALSLTYGHAPRYEGGEWARDMLDWVKQTFHLQVL